MELSIDWDRELLCLSPVEQAERQFLLRIKKEESGVVIRVQKCRTEPRLGTVLTLEYQDYICDLYGTEDGDKSLMEILTHHWLQGRSLKFEAKTRGGATGHKPIWQFSPC